jgi:hypothetical protein
MRRPTNGELVAVVAVVAVAVLVAAAGQAFVQNGTVKPYLYVVGIAVMLGVVLSVASLRPGHGGRVARVMSRPVSDRTGNRIGGVVSLAWFCLAGLLVFAAVIVKGWTLSVLLGLLVNFGIVLVGGRYLSAKLRADSLVPYAASSVAGVTVFLLIAALG